MTWKTKTASGCALVAVGACAAVVLAGGYTHGSVTPVRVKHPVPVLTYARTFQGVLDAARPKDEPRILVKGCIAGPTLNRHFCAWTSNNQCHAGMIAVTPGEGTVPESHGRVPIQAFRCSPRAVLHWLGSQTREGG